MAKHRPTLSLIVPCFNEEAVIGITNETLLKTLGERQNLDFEIIYIDDGSVDATRQLLAGFCEKDGRIRSVELSRNFGHQQAISAGLDFARGDVVGIIDADLQDPPDVILRMLDQWEAGADVVFGIRENRQEGWLKRASYKLFYVIYRALSDIDVPRDSGDFCLMDRKVVEVLKSFPERNRFLRGLRSWVGFNQVGVRYDRDARAAGDSKYTFIRLMSLAIDGIVNFSIKPIAIVSLIGIAVSTMSVVAALLLTAWKLWGFQLFGHSPADVPGWASMVFLFLFFSGLQILTAGVVGSYIGRMYAETKQRPIYVVRQVSGLERDSDHQLLRQYAPYLLRGDNDRSQTGA